jgi:GNAT superfamily N-acetyltransferase
MLGDFFVALSPATRELYAPHEFSHTYAAKLCSSQDFSRTIPLIATDQKRERGVAYFLLCLHVFDEEARRYEGYGVHLDNVRDCMLAPCVADEYQGQGVASALVPPLLSLTRALQRRYLILYGGTQARNARGLRFYAKAGFREMGRFPEDGFNVDMMLDLENPPPL